MKNNIIYHNRDMDGFCSGAIARLFLEKNGIDNPNMIGWDYGMPIPVIEKGSSVIMLDISFPTEEMVWLAENTNFTWIDHHKTAIRDSEINFYSYVDGVRLIGDSASLLAWKHLIPSDVPEVVEYVDAYDTFKKDDGALDKWDKVMAIQYGLRSKMKDPADGIEYLKWKDLLCDDDKCISLYNDGLVVLGYVEQYNEILSKFAFRLQFQGHMFLALNALGGSTVVDSIITPEYDGILMFTFTGHDWSMSMYGNGKDIDLSAIAKKYGGGGHANACGFRVNDIRELFYQGQSTLSL